MLARNVMTIARFTLLEALRNRLVWLLLLIVTAGFGLALLAGQVAITEGAQIQAALSAAFYRLGAVFLLAGFVVFSQSREFNDKGTELLLALPLPRAGYFFGKLLGYGACALPLALVCSLPLLAFAPFPQIAAWGLSLSLELIIIATASLFCVLALPHAIAALAAVGGFYLLARSITALQLIAAGPLLNQDSLPQRAIIWLLDTIALLLPRLDGFADTAWLTTGAGGFAALPNQALQSLLFVALLCAAALFDLYRKNF